MTRKREFDFDGMLGTGQDIREGDAARKAQGVPPGNTGTQESRWHADTPAPAAHTTPLRPKHTGLQVTRNTEVQDLAGETVTVEQMLAGLLADHASLRTGTAKKTTFDFMPEFARALKRWSVDSDISMRDLVLTAVAQIIPSEYLREYRKTGNQK